ncbi:MAG: family 20 glycosylhydrolase, partial [Desulfobulbaceae bacterium]|nr:family 20 glycosylhydrolase [Desulfobulbaceae bacterium]
AHYLIDAAPYDSPLSEEEQKLILGGEATMWAEFVTPETIDSRIWPRTAAIAERFWSPREANDVADMYRRLENISIQLEEHGLTHEKNYNMMLRRLARGNEFSALKNFVNIVEPVKIYRRNSLLEHTSYSPMTRVVDTARPDAKTAREFNATVNAYLKNKTTEQANQIRSRLRLWQDNHTQLEQTIKLSPILCEISPLSESLSVCAATGLEALSSLENGTKLNKSIFQEASKSFEEAKKPYGQVELQVIAAIEKLVDSAVE